MEVAIRDLGVIGGRRTCALAQLQLDANANVLLVVTTLVFLPKKEMWKEKKCSEIFLNHLSTLPLSVQF